MFEGVGGWGETLAGGGVDHEFSALFSPGVRHAINLDDGSQLVLGLAVPIGLSGDAPDYGVFFYVSFEHGFGSGTQP